MILFFRLLTCCSPDRSSSARSSPGTSCSSTLRMPSVALSAGFLTSTADTAPPPPCPHLTHFSRSSSRRATLSSSEMRTSSRSRCCRPSLQSLASRARASAPSSSRPGRSTSSCSNVRRVPQPQLLRAPSLTSPSSWRSVYDTEAPAALSLFAAYLYYHALLRVPVRRLPFLSEGPFTANAKVCFLISSKVAHSNLVAGAQGPSAVARGPDVHVAQLCALRHLARALDPARAGGSSRSPG